MMSGSITTDCKQSGHVLRTWNSKEKSGIVTTNSFLLIVWEPCANDRVATIEAVGNIYSLHSQRTLPALLHVELQWKLEKTLPYPEPCTTFSESG